MGILPSLLPGLQEQINNITSETSSTVEKLGRCFLFDFEKEEYVIKDGKLVEIANDTEKVKQWVKLVLRTYKDKYKVYKDTNFYCNTEDLRGTKLNGFVKSEIAREITESLLTHRYIKKVSGFSFIQERLKITVNFNVTLIDGTTFSESEVF